ncbi:hypothetical protein L218DRAFT_1071437 [Marasmius fiardii PR-910]|nr:hypothetical protein L218DRAFT_1071437 [Marasmius fiardii PR-910]
MCFGMLAGSTVDLAQCATSGTLEALGVSVPIHALANNAPGLIQGGELADVGHPVNEVLKALGGSLTSPPTGINEKPTPRPLKNYDATAYPKLVALDTDWTIFWGWLDSDTWGKGAGASRPVEDNIEKINYWDIRDRTNHSVKCGMYADVPDIIHDILKNGAKLAIVSRNRSKELCDKALWQWTVPDAQGNQRPLIDLVSFNEVYDESKTNHFKKIKGLTNFDYSDMILYDDEAINEAINNDVEMMLGVTFQVSRDQKGLTWDNYKKGLEMWRRNKAIRSPWLRPNIEPYDKRKLIGYSGMDSETIKLLQAGERRRDKEEAARWGYAMYIADDPAVAKYFRDWIKKTTPAFCQSETLVCAIYARDGDIFDSLPKIWFPEDWQSMTINLKKPENEKEQKELESQIAWNQEDRDRKAESWGVEKPYILFSRHLNMGNGWGLEFPIPGSQRFTEMVVYSQIQEALLLTVPMSEHEVAEASHLHCEQQFSAWNITVPAETRADFAVHGETF